MAKKKVPLSEDTSSHAKARTDIGREQQLIALAYDLVEQRLRDGTATSQETTHFLKMGSSKEKRERIMDEKQMALLDAKAEALASAKRIEALYQKAIDAKLSYQSPATTMQNVNHHD